MKTLTLKNIDLLNLQSEVVNVIDNCKSFTAKFYLNNLLAQIEPIAKNFNDLKNEMINKYGQENASGVYEVIQFEEDGITETEKFIEYKPQINELLYTTDVEVEYSPIKLSVFDTVESDKYYPILFKFIKE